MSQPCGTIVVGWMPRCLVIFLLAVTIWATGCSGTQANPDGDSLPDGDTDTADGDGLPPDGDRDDDRCFLKRCPAGQACDGGYLVLVAAEHFVCEGDECVAAASYCAGGCVEEPYPHCEGTTDGDAVEADGDSEQDETSEEEIPDQDGDWTPDGDTGFDGDIGPDGDREPDGDSVPDGDFDPDADLDPEGEEPLDGDLEPDGDYDPDSPPDGDTDAEPDVNDEDYFLDADDDCTPVHHQFKACYEGDVYWYDSCWHREGKKEECGTNGCDTGACMTGLTPGFVLIPAGTFTMGSPATEPGRDTDETQHSVRLTYDIELMAHKVTQAEFFAFAGTNPSWFGPNADGPDCGADCPVERVTWYEAVAYANWLSIQKGLEPCYDLYDCRWDIGAGCEPDERFCDTGYHCAIVSIDKPTKPQECEGYRLPTEAEWEYAMRAGTATAFYDGQGIDTAHADCLTPFHLEEIGWYCGNGDNTSHPVGRKAPNRWGLYDMSGNVWEWLWDYYCSDITASWDNPIGCQSAIDRVVRGGSFYDPAKYARSAFRGTTWPDYAQNDTGFRLARTLRVSTPGFTRIKAGTFTMGSPTTELGRGTDETQHAVTLTYDFEMMVGEVTQAEFAAFARDNPSWFGPNGDGEDCETNCPVERVSWFEAAAYANWLSERHGLAPCYLLGACTGTIGSGCLPAETECTAGSYACASLGLNGVDRPQDCPGFRLPTESEWEYAARAGSTTAFYSGNIRYLDCTYDYTLSSIGWYCGSSYSTTHPVGYRTMNAAGVLGTSGNVLEWVWDWYGPYSGTATDPVGPDTGSDRVLRGGSWNDVAPSCRSAYREHRDPGTRSNELGFRLVRSLPAPLCTHGICTDQQTGLAWQQTPSTQRMTWINAATYCRNLNLLGRGWRLPNVSELRSAVRNCDPIESAGTCGVDDLCPTCGMETACLSDACWSASECDPSSCADNGGPEGCYWPAGFAGACDQYWSSSEDESSSDRAWSVHFRDGRVGDEPAGDQYRARCVRGGAAADGGQTEDGDSDQECLSHAFSACTSTTYGDVYWFDSCWNQEEKKEECHNCDCEDGACVLDTKASHRCYDNDVYWYDCHGVVSSKLAECGAAGCDESACRLFSCGSGACFDPVTGLRWVETPSSGPMNWTSAVAYCQNLTSPSTGWRLPNISELRTLVRNCGPIETAGACGVEEVCSACGTDATCIADACCITADCNPSSCTNNGGPNGCYWPVDLKGACGSYWSSSTNETIPAQAWHVSFINGQVFSAEKAVSTVMRTRCVK